MEISDSVDYEDLNKENALLWKRNKLLESKLEKCKQVLMYFEDNYGNSNIAMRARKVLNEEFVDERTK